MSYSTPKEAPAPSAVFTQLPFGKQIAYSLAAIARIGVADHNHSVRRVDELAEKVAAQPAALFRMMRLLASLGVSSKPRDGASLLPQCGKGALQQIARALLRQAARSLQSTVSP